MAVAECLAKVEWRRLDELLAKTPRHKLLHHGNELKNREVEDQEEGSRERLEKRRRALQACKVNNDKQRVKTTGG